MEVDQQNQPAGEAVEWLQKIFDHGKSTHNENLFSYFRGQSKHDDLTLPVVNLVTASCKAVFGTSTSSDSSKPPTAAAQLGIDPSACASYLYYIVAEGLLQQLFPRDAQDPTASAAKTAAGSRRFKGMVKVANPPACTELVGCQEFHLPLIECALLLVHHITTPQSTGSGTFHVSKVLQREDRAALLWQAARNFMECFGPSSPFPMPKQLQSHLHDVQAQLLQGPVFQTGSIIYELLMAGGGCQFQPGDMSLPHNITASYAAQAILQTQTIAWDLQQSHTRTNNNNSTSSSGGLCESFHQHCAWLMDQVVLRHLDICFGVHMAVVVACVVYVTAKIQQTPLSFATVTQAVSALLKTPSSELFTNTEISVQPPSRGDMRAFYNNRFLPAVQGHVRCYLQQHQVQATEQPPTLPAAAPYPAAPHSAPHMDTTINMLEASQLPQAATTRVPFSTIATKQLAVVLTSKPSTKSHSRPASQVVAAQDKENAAVLLGVSSNDVFAGVPQFRSQPIAGHGGGLNGGRTHGTMYPVVMR